MSHRRLILVTGAALAIAIGCAGDSDSPTDTASKVAQGGTATTTEAIDGVPAEVLTAIESAVPGGVIVAVEQEVEDGATVYEAKVTFEGKTFEVEVAADGTVIEVEEDDDSDSDGDSDGDSDSDDDSSDSADSDDQDR